MARPHFTDTEQKILALAGGDIDLVEAPYAKIAEACGTDEQTVIELLRRLKDEGIIRRFGATLRHQKAGYGHNAMVAWIVPEERVDEIGELFASQPEISHCYHRVTYPEWQYNMYTMIHGKEPGECLDVAARLSKETGIAEYTALRSLRELKKTSMRYFK